MDISKVKVGQVWRTWDTRYRKYADDSPAAGRFEVVEIQDPFAVVVGLDGQKVKRKIRIDRMKPTSTGYKMLKDVEAPSMETA